MMRKTSPCCLYLLLQLSLWTLVSSVLVTLVLSVYLYKDEYSVFVGLQDEVIVHYPKLFCKTISFKQQQIQGVSLQNKGCVMSATKPTEGHLIKVKRSGVRSVELLNSDNDDNRVAVFVQNLKSESIQPFFWNNQTKVEDCEFEDYTFNVNITFLVSEDHGAYNTLGVLVKYLDSFEEFNSHIDASKEKCVEDPDNILTWSESKATKSFKSKGSSTKIIVMCAYKPRDDLSSSTSEPNESFTPSQSQIELDISYQIVKFNQIMKSSSDCSFSQPPNVTVHCSHIPVGVNETCEVTTEFYERDYFKDDKWTLYEPIVLVGDSDADTLWNVKCDLRVDLMTLILLAQLLILLLIILASCSCCSRAKNPY